MVTLSQCARPAVFEVDSIDEHGQHRATAIAGEHALTLYLDKRELVTLMTLGADPEYLCLGYLRNQRLLASPELIDSIQVDWETSSAAITSRSLAQRGLSLWEAESSSLEQQLAHRTVTTGCGQGTVFGGLMDDLANLHLPEKGQLRQADLLDLLEQMRHHDSIYRTAGAVHGCALFDLAIDPAPDERPRLLRFVEDVGRHNAVDAIAGWMWLHQPRPDPQRLHIFYTTGRLTSEMVIKSAQMGIAVLVSRSGLTHMGHDLATRLGMTLIGRCQGRHFLIFSGSQRFIAEPALAQHPLRQPGP